MRPSPFRGRWLFATLFILALAILFVRLGFWQLQRLDERRQSNAEVLARMEQPEITVDGTSLAPETADLRLAAVRGMYDYERETVLRNRTLNEQPGVHVLTPLRISDSNTAILVDRGWIPYEQSAPDKRAAFDRPAGEVEVHGILRQSQSRRGRFSPEDPAPMPGGSPVDAWHRVDLPRIQTQIPYPLLPLFLEEAASTTISDQRLPRPSPEIALDEGPHLAYAIQWFAFAAIALGGYAAYARSKTRAAQFDNG